MESVSKFDLDVSLLQGQEVDVRCQETEVSEQMLTDRYQQKEVGSWKWEVGKGRGTKIPTQSRLSSVFYLLSSLLVLILATSCNPDRPKFEPSYSGAPPTEDLDQYLDTKAVFEGLDQVKGKRQQLDSILTLADKLKNYDDDVALVYADTAYSMATEKNWQLSRGIASYYIALLKGRREKYGEGIEDALVDAEISMQLFEGIQNYPWLLRINNLIAIFHEKKKNSKMALTYLDSAMHILKQGQLRSKDSINLAGELLHDYANISKTTDTMRSREQFLQSYKLYKLANNEPGLIRLELDFANLLFKQKKLDRAEDLILNAIEKSRHLKDIQALAFGYQKLGVLRILQYQESGQVADFHEAIKSNEKCFQYQEEDLYYLYNTIGQNYQLRASMSDEVEVVYSSVDSAIVAYKKAMEEARKEGALVVLKKMGRNISGLCEWRQRSTEVDCSQLLGSSVADFLNSNYAAITDTIGQILQTANQRNRAFQRWELEIKSQQRSRVQWIISGAGLLLASLVFVVLLQGQQQKRLRAKMEALRAQINPHFISNSLDAIESLVNLDKKEAATKYLVHFSRLTRKVLNSSRDGKVNLAEEIKTLEHFLELEQLRFRNKLRYLIDIDEDINPGIVEMPAMILQPYIENAIWHGIKPKQGPGLVRVQVERDGKYLVCIIKDNGVGRTKAAEIKAASVLQQNSVGMKINQERLNVVGRAKGAKVEIIDLYDEEGKANGTQVIIRLPYKEITKT